MNEIIPFTYSESLSFEDVVKNLDLGLSKHSLKLDKAEKKEEERICEILSQFSTISGYEKVTVLLILKYRNVNYNSYLVLLTFNSYDSVVSKIPHSIKSVDCEIVGLTSMNCDLGKVFIRPETLSDKLVELVNPVEIDFPQDKEFSSKYYVISEDENQLRNNIDYNILKAIKRYNDLHIEINEKNLLARTLKPINQKSIDAIVGLMNDLIKT